MNARIKVTALLHDYGAGPILEIPHLEITSGRTHLAGPNGAGKTSLLRILATLLTPTRGEIMLHGHRLPQDAKMARSITGYAGHHPSLHATLTASDALTLHADLHDLPRNQAHEALDAWGLTEEATTRVENLSHGQQRRLDLARALLHQPRVVLLDEPCTGLDEEAKRLLVDRLDDVDPALVLVAAPTNPGVPTDETFSLYQGRLVEAPS